MTRAVSESEFYMWRTLFAVVHADNVVTNEEVRFMAEALEDIAFSKEQRAVLSDDIKHPKDIAQMFALISDSRDQARFFKYARDLVHADGDYGAEEQDIMLKVLTSHIRDVDIDALIGQMDMELELEEEEDGDLVEKHKGRKSIIYSFRRRFLKDRFGV